MFDNLKRMNIRKVALQVLNILTIFSLTQMVWKTLALTLNTENPIIVVYSAVMDPTFHRGDVLILYLSRNKPIDINDICVFKLSERLPLPLVHRIIKLHDELDTGRQYLLTKGDGNYLDDRVLYDDGQMWIHQEDVIGKVKWVIPRIGMVDILMTDYPSLKYVVLGILFLLAVVKMNRFFF